MANLGFDDDFMDSMLSDFLDESQEYLSRLNDNLLTLDELASALSGDQSVQVDSTVLNEMFRDAHSLKGLSAMLQLDDINRLTHRIESIFDAARNGELGVSRPVIDLVFDAVDRLTQMVDHLSQPGASPVEYESILTQICRLLEHGELPAADERAEETTAADVGQADHAIPPTAGTENAAADRHDPFANLQNDEDIPQKYVSIFISEVDESIDALSDFLMSAGPNAVSDALVVCHRIKGAAASIGLHRCARLAHSMEDILQELRECGQPLTPTMVDALLPAVDAIREFLQGLRKGIPDDDRFAEAYQTLVACMAMSGESMQADSPSFESRSSESDSEEWSGFTDSDRRQLTEKWPGDCRAAIGMVVLEAELALASLKRRLIFDRLQALGKVFVTVPSMNDSETDDESRRMLFGLATDRTLEEIRQSLIVDGVEHVHCEVLAPGEAASTRDSLSGSAAAACPAPTKKTEKPDTTPSSANRSTAAKSASKPAETIRVEIERLDQLMNLTGQLVISKARFAELCEQLKSLVGRKQLLHCLDGLENRLGTMVGDMGGPETPFLRNHVESMRRDLKTIRSALQEIVASRTVVHELGEAVHQLGRVSDGIQKSVMDTRMVPVGPLFRRFKRVIRDITRSNGKDIRLVIRGEKTELDKRMIDELSDPLIHMVRNSADHGVESPQERQAAGKPPQGVVTLDAFHQGNQICIQVRDDGRGLDAEKLKEKAVRKGLLTAEDAARMAPSDAYKLIWEPGFSTAEQVTEVSGRGMGMDIVRSRIERLSGSIELESELGKGTLITIRLPLTLAILPSLLTVVRDDVFAIPLESVVEIVRVSQSEVATVRGSKTARVRGEVISICELEQLFVWNRSRPPSPPASDEWTMVVVGNGKDKLGLVVDGVIGEDDIVIKSLEENYRQVPGLAGASILGNGRVSLILDVVAVMDLARQRRPRPSIDAKRLANVPEGDDTSKFVCT